MRTINRFAICKSVIRCFTILCTCTVFGQSSPFSFSLVPSARFALNGKEDTALFRRNGYGFLLKGDFASPQRLGVRVEIGVDDDGDDQSAIENFIKSRGLTNATATKTRSQKSYVMVGPVYKFGNRFSADLSAQAGIFFNTPSSITIQEQGSIRANYRTEPGSKNTYAGFGGSASFHFALGDQWSLGLSTSLQSTKTSVRVFDSKAGGAVSGSAQSFSKNITDCLAGVSIRFNPSAKNDKGKGSNSRVKSWVFPHVLDRVAGQHWGDPHVSEKTIKAISSTNEGKLLKILSEIDQAVNTSFGALQSITKNHTCSSENLRVEIEAISKIIQSNPDIVNLAVGDEGVTEDQNNPKPSKVAVDEPGVIDNRVKPSTRQTNQSSFGTRTSGSPVQQALFAAVNSSNSNIKNLIATLDEMGKTIESDNTAAQAAINSSNSNIKNLITILGSFSDGSTQDNTDDPVQAAVNSSNSNIKNLLAVLNDVSTTLNGNSSASLAAINSSNSNIKNMITGRMRIENKSHMDDWSQTGSGLNSLNPDTKNKLVRLEAFNRITETHNGAAKVAVNSSNSNIKNLISVLDDLNIRLGKHDIALNAIRNMK